MGITYMLTDHDDNSRASKHATPSPVADGVMYPNEPQRSQPAVGDRTSVGGGDSVRSGSIV